MKKILLIIAIIFCIFQMIVLAVEIDIGTAAIDRNTFTGIEVPVTRVVIGNPANETGKITSVEIWAQTDLVNCEVATFFVVSGNNLSTRDTEYIGAVTAGSKQTFPGLNLDVVVGDYIGICFSGGRLRVSNDTGVGYWYLSGDNIPCTDVTFTQSGVNYELSLYGTGTTVEVEANVLFFGTNF